VSRSLSADPSFSKEAEVDALTDLLVQNMNVAGNPDFCGMHTHITYAYACNLTLFTIVNVCKMLDLARQKHYKNLLLLKMCMYSFK